VANKDLRWIDNLLSRFPLPGVARAGQGNARSISTAGVYHIALVSKLVDALELGVEPAAALAIRLLDAVDDRRVVLFDALELRFDRATFTASVDARIAEAVEWVVPPRRGRPSISRRPVRIESEASAPPLNEHGAPPDERRPV
jgi:hypothetical protein